MTNLNYKLKLAICGSKGVGKSAIAVRYLTKRFISGEENITSNLLDLNNFYIYSSFLNFLIKTEYSSLREHFYKQTAQFDDNVVAEVEILDTCCIPNNIDYQRWADCFLIVYSIVNRESFYEAELILQQLSKLKLPSYYSTLLVGNKCDLEHNRVVKTEEAQNLSAIYNTQYIEVSAAEGFSDISIAFQSLLKDSRSSVLQRNLPVRRKIGVNSVSKALGNIFGKNSKMDRKRPSLSI